MEDLQASEKKFRSVDKPTRWTCFLQVQDVRNCVTGIQTHHHDMKSDPVFDIKVRSTTAEVPGSVTVSRNNYCTFPFMRTALFWVITHLKMGPIGCPRTSVINDHYSLRNQGTAVARWLRYCATNQKVAGSIPDGVMNFSVTKILLIALWP
jgi:hypothetical protein